jgi:hypothetical protein
MKTLVALLAFSIPLGAAAATRRGEVKAPAQVVSLSALPDCAEGMEPGTACRYIPLSSVTFNIPNVVPDLPPLPLKILLPAGFRGIHAQLRLEVSPSSVCDPVPSDVYDGAGGLTIDCENQR